MRAIRYILQVGTFLFFAAWFLCLVVGRPFRIPELLPLAIQKPVSAEINIKPSPIEMLKRAAR